MAYAEQWAEHVLPRVLTVCRQWAVDIVYQPPDGDLYLGDALDDALNLAIRSGANRLTEPVFRDLEAMLLTYIADQIERQRTFAIECEDKRRDLVALRRTDPENFRVAVRKIRIAHQKSAIERRNQNVG